MLHKLQYQSSEIEMITNVGINVGKRKSYTAVQVRTKESTYEINLDVPKNE